MPVKLCQRPRASCGACCGIYNRRDPTRAAVRAELARHTRVLARTERTPEAFRAAASRLAEHAPEPIFSSIRVCQLVGYLDEQETRVGCLAHPRATGGIDLRACGVYDVETCESFLCPSHATLTERDAALVGAVTDFHLYGLVATDGPFVRAVLDGVAALAGKAVEDGHEGDARFARSLQRLFAVKEELAAGSDGLFGPFHHEPEAADAMRLSVVAASDALDGICAALGADERSGNDPDLLAGEVGARLTACADALRAIRLPASPK